MADMRIEIAVGTFGAAERPMYINPEFTRWPRGRGCPSDTEGG
jgi:hypothetical protein